MNTNSVYEVNFITSINEFCIVGGIKVSTNMPFEKIIQNAKERIAENCTEKAKSEGFDLTIKSDDVLIVSIVNVTLLQLIEMDVKNELAAFSFYKAINDMRSGKC